MDFPTPMPLVVGDTFEVHFGVWINTYEVVRVIDAFNFEVKLADVVARVGT
jgi:hypothetical protein